MKKKTTFKQWLRTWDAGAFDMTEALTEAVAGDPMPKEATEHAWKEKPVEGIEEGEIRIFTRFYPVAAAVLCTVLIGFLLLTVAKLPAFGAADAPAHNEVMQRYVEQGMEETGAVNVVAGVILDYRAFDTLGESHVLFTAATAVTILLMSLGGAVSPVETKLERNIMQKDPLLHSTVRIMVPLVIVYGIYVILNGHLGPGGGFSGGAVIGGGLILYAIAFGFDELDKILNFKVYRRIVLASLCFYSLAKCYSFFCGANHLESIFVPGTPGMIFSAGLILPLNIAVGIVVACTMYGFYSVFTRGRI
ncbi:MAG: MnhB domain-containing protein [Clostridia bacterium]|nr:MnhB domain-containing protein [Clostridia bacterium]